MKYLIKAILLGTCFLLSENCYAESKTYLEMSLDELKTYANKGDGFAQAYLSGMYGGLFPFRPNDKAEINCKEALKWVNKSVEQKNPFGQFMMSSMYRKGKCLTQNEKKAFSYALKSAKQGNAAGQNAVGYSYEYGSGVKQDLHQAVVWYQRAVDQNYPEAQVQLAVLYMLGAGVPEDYAKAFKLASEAAQQNFALSFGLLGTLYENGWGTRQNKTAAKEWFGKECDAGFQDGCDSYRKLNEAGY